MEVLLALAADDDVVELGGEGDFVSGGLEAPFNFVGVVGGAVEEAFSDLVEGAWFDKDGVEAAGHFGDAVFVLAEGAGSLDIDIEEEVKAGLEELAEVAGLGTVEAAMDAGPLDESVLLNGLLEGFGGKEVIIDALVFAGARWPGSGGDDAAEVGKSPEHALAEGGFAATGRAADNEHDGGGIAGDGGLHGSGVGIDEDFAWAGPIFGADDPLILKDVHNAGGAIVADLEAALEHGSGGAFAGADNLDGLGDEIILGVGVILGGIVFAGGFEIFAEALVEFRFAIGLVDKVDDTGDFVIADEGSLGADEVG